MYCCMLQVNHIRSDTNLSLPETLGFYIDMLCHFEEVPFLYNYSTDEQLD